MDTDSGVSDVKRLTDLAALVGERVKLRKRGSGLAGRCALCGVGHESLRVTPAKGLWHCFACRRGGSAIQWVMALENATFAEAIAKLRARAGL